MVINVSKLSKLTGFGGVKQPLVLENHVLDGLLHFRLPTAVQDRASGVKTIKMACIEDLA